MTQHENRRNAYQSYGASSAIYYRITFHRSQRIRGFFPRMRRII